MPSILTLTPAQYAAVVTGQRDRIVQDVAREIAWRAHGHRVAAIGVDQVRGWADEAAAAGIVAPGDLRDALHLFADLHWAGGRPAAVQARLADPAVGGRLKLFQMRLAFAEQRVARAA